jgi:hypothetical protein
MTLHTEDHKLEIEAAREWAAAQAGLGWEDLTVHFEISEEQARRIVWRAEAERRVKRSKLSKAL